MGCAPSSLPGLPPAIQAPDPGEPCDYTNTNNQGPLFVMRPDQLRPIRFAKSGYGSAEMIKPTTLLQDFKLARMRHGDSLAMRIERPTSSLAIDGQGKAPPPLPLNEWKSWTWEEYYLDCVAVAKGLLAQNVQRYEGVVVYGFNSPEWFCAQMGITMAGGLTAGIYPTDEAPSVAFKTNHSGARVAIVEDAGKIRRYEEKIDEIPKLTTIVVYGYGYKPASNTTNQVLTRKDGTTVQILTWQQFLDEGISKVIDGDAKVDAIIESIKPEDCFTLVYTSGTTGNSKGCQISHDNITWEVSTVMKLNPALGEAGQERIISFLPLSHVAALTIDIALPMIITARCAGYGTTHFARPYDLKAGSLGDRLRAVRPTVFLGVPRVWEKIAERLREVGRQTKGLKKKIATWAKAQSLEYQKNLLLGGSGMVPSGYARAESMVLSKVKERLGLDACKFAISGAAPISRDILEYFASLGVCILELYGMSENTGAATINTHYCHLWGSIGFMLPGTEVKILRPVETPANSNGTNGTSPTYVEAKPAQDIFNPTEEEQGELCYRGRHIMMGYLSNPAMGDEADVLAKNKAAIDENGFLHSGDKGCVGVNGMFRCTGRYKELIKGSGGENIAPVPIEERMLQLCGGVISKAIMIGDKRKYNTMLITLPQEGTDGNVTPGNGILMGTAAKSLSPGITTVEAAAKDPIWIKYLEAKLDELNKDKSVVLSDAYRVQKLCILSKDFSVDGGDMTPTLKFKRGFIDEKYKAAIDLMYNATGGEKIFQYFGAGG
jgi:long-chain-fatty-acid--CoA ligase ACSBG